MRTREKSQLIPNSLNSFDNTSRAVVYGLHRSGSLFSNRSFPTKGTFKRRICWFTFERKGTPLPERQSTVLCPILSRAVSSLRLLMPRRIHTTNTSMHSKNSSTRTLSVFGATRLLSSRILKLISCRKPFVTFTNSSLLSFEMKFSATVGNVKPRVSDSYSRESVQDFLSTSGMRMLTFVNPRPENDSSFRLKLGTISSFKREYRIRGYKDRKTLHPPA